MVPVVPVVPVVPGVQVDLGGPGSPPLVQRQGGLGVRVDRRLQARRHQHVGPVAVRHGLLKLCGGYYGMVLMETQGSSATRPRCASLATEQRACAEEGARREEIRLGVASPSGFICNLFTFTQI